MSSGSAITTTTAAAARISPGARLVIVDTGPSSPTHAVSDEMRSACRAPASIGVLEVVQSWGEKLREQIAGTVAMPPDSKGVG